MLAATARLALAAMERRRQNAHEETGIENRRCNQLVRAFYVLSGNADVNRPPILR